jgi:hypothetical protein
MLFAQEKSKDSLVSCFLHVNINPNTGFRDYGNIKFFKLHYNNADVKWESDEMIPLDKDSLGYLVNANIPRDIYESNKMIDCAAFVSAYENIGGDTIKRYDYVGVKLSNITLQLNSNPAGAEIYMFPNRYWTSAIEKTNWQKNISDYWKFKVGTSTTNTFVKIDQTVYVIVFKLGDQFKQTILFTKPESVQNQETISVNF